MEKRLTEMLGTFILVTAIGLTGDPLVMGAALMVAVYMGGHISGAHYNPAVTLAVYMRGKISGKEAMEYLYAQLLGALVAAAYVFSVKGVTFAPEPMSSIGVAPIFLSEVVFTMILAIVVLNTTVNPATKGNSYYGLAIGFTVFVGAACVGMVSGGAFNPAAAFGSILLRASLGEGSLIYLWHYIVGPLVGGGLGAIFYGLQQGE